MINKKKKKGFTIVELVIVIVIIGILAAVLIPTFGSLIQKANESADKQTVYQMNIILAAELIDESLEGDALLAKVKNILDENGFDVDNLSPASDDLKFMWDKVNKVVILVRDNGTTKTQIYPAVSGDATVADSNVIEIGSSQGGSEGGDDEDDDEENEVVKIGIASGTDLSTLAEGVYYLTEAMTVTTATTISNNITIDLNGSTLTLGENASLVIQGNVTISDSLRSNVATINEVEDEPLTGIIIETNSSPDWLEEYLYSVKSTPGIQVGSEDDNTGSLTLQNVDITGKGYTNIKNYGTLSLFNVKFTATGGSEYGGGQVIWNKGTIANISGSTIIVDCDCGIYNEGTITDISSTIFNVMGGNNSGFGVYGITNVGPATINSTTFNIYDGCYGFQNYYSDSNVPEAVKISGGEFIANGSNVTPVKNGDAGLYPSTMNITNSTFKEGEVPSVTYFDDAPISVSGGEVRLDGVTVTLGEDVIAAAERTENPVFTYCVSASYDSKVIIDSNGEGESSFNYVLFCNTEASYTIYGGTFYNKGATPTSIDFAALYENAPIYRAPSGVELKEVDDSYWVIEKPE